MSQEITATLHHIKRSLFISLCCDTSVIMAAVLPVRQLSSPTNGHGQSCLQWLHAAHVLVERRAAMELELDRWWMSSRSCIESGLHLQLDDERRELGSARHELLSEIRRTLLLLRAKASSRAPSSSSASDLMIMIRRTADARRAHMDQVAVLQVDADALACVEKDATELLARLSDVSLLRQPTSARHGGNMDVITSCRGATTPLSSHSVGCGGMQSSDNIGVACAEFLARHGGTASLGWTEADHAAFLRWIVSSADDHVTHVAAIEALEAALPHHSHEDILEHVQLYTTYCDLLNRKRLAVTAYREQKEADRAEEDATERLRETMRLENIRDDEIRREAMRRRHADALHAKLQSWKARRQQEEEEEQVALRVKQNPPAEEEVVIRRPLRAQRSHQPSHLDPTSPPEAAPTQSKPTKPTEGGVVISASVLHRRWEADAIRVAERCGAIQLKRQVAATTKADITELLASRLKTAPRGRSASDGGSRPQSSKGAAATYAQPTASSSYRRSLSSQPSNSSASVVGGVGRDGPHYLTPTNAAAATGAHRAAASWCDMTHLRR